MNAATHPFVVAVRKALRAQANVDVKRSAERYFLGAVHLHGVKTPKVMALWRSMNQLVLPEAIETVLAVSLELLRGPFLEEHQLANQLLRKRASEIPEGFVDELARLFDERVTNWATCDMLCGGVLREMVRRGGRARARVARWSRATTTWRKRASAVAFVNEARTGAHTDLILEVCRRIVRDPERFVQLGAGWVLRELSLCDHERVVAFLLDNATFVSREGLRYAIEKMGPTERTRVLDEHKRRCAGQRASNQRKIRRGGARSAAARSSRKRS